MPDSVHPMRLTCLPRARLLTAATLLSGVLMAGCGGSSGSPSATAGVAGTPTSAVTAGAGVGGSGSTASGADRSLLAFARCMRANGVTNFPDPQPGGGARFSVPAGSSPAAPAFRAAQAKCQQLLPNGGHPGSGRTASAQTLAKLLRIARCMRRHGVPQFPDPRTSVQSTPGSVQVITDFDGAFLMFPTTINLQAPAYKQALAACGAPPLGLPH